MRIKHLLLGLVSLVMLNLGLSINSYAVSFNTGTINVTQYKLDNGLTVILNEDHSKPEVFGVVMVKAGGKNDPADATGMAHYMEHMLFKGTQKLGTTNWEKEKPHIDKIFALYDELGKTTDEIKRKDIQTQINEESLKAAEYAIPNELSNLINEMGGSNMNAGTGPDYTVFYNKFPSSQVEKWIDLYAHRFAEPVFRSFQAELEVVYEEKNLYSDQFQTKLLEEFQRHFFKNHPYGQQTLIGTVDDLKNPSLTKMYDFFKTYYVPNNMAVVLSGDFDSNEVMPLIEKNFGKWVQNDIPEARVWNEEPFDGREFHEAKLTPVKMVLLGFRAPSATQEESLVADITLKMLNNSYSTGLLDKLTIDGEILAAQSLSMPYYDHGATIILIIPKIIGQKFDDAESIVMAEIEKLKKGEFDDWMLDAMKKDIYRSHNTSMESNESRALLFADAFTKGQSIEEALSYADKIMKISKDDVVEMANTIFGPNYLAFHSKMGFPKKDKIEKPDYKPLTANTNAKSEYAQHFENISTHEPKMQPIDFNRDVTTKKIYNGHRLLAVNNPVNDIFSLTFAFEVGEVENPLLQFATTGINMSGAGEYDVTQLKEEFAKIGTSYNVFANNSYTYVDVQGIEEHLPRTMELISLLISDPKLEQNKIKTIIEGEATNRKMERSEADNVAHALLEYGLYNQSSSYIDRLTSKEVKKLQAAALVDAFKKATGYTCQIRFTGTSSAEDVAALVKKHIPLAQNPTAGNSPIDRLAQQYTENTVLFVNKKKARQSKVFLFMNGAPFNIENVVPMQAFNDYFGGGFSGLILQEIREYRSLAYSAGGNFSAPSNAGNPTDFIGYVETQADKTITAMETFNGLIRDMPAKTERIDMIRNHLQLSALTKRPSFRGLASTVESWKNQGYEADPMVTNMPAYKNITWDTVDTFYKENMKDKPLVYMIVGDKRNIDFKGLSKYGQVVEVKEKKLFTK
ncbi:MAG: insulinase family protein [Bacteroidales bacterium]|nr:insulinase family protein [Bacteroidales bacterium]MDD4672726.1 insulinase family protein [Bacteroidales bacterium]